jgi:hypothetical protein
MERRTVLGALLALGWSIPRLARAEGARFVIIGNKTNPSRALGAGEIEAIFTTRRLFRSDGRAIIPFNFPPRHPTRIAFDRAALHFEPDEVARYWIDRRIRGGHPPPRQVPDAQTMLRVVASLEDAIGYVPADLADTNVNIIGEL